MGDFMVMVGKFHRNWFRSLNFIIGILLLTPFILAAIQPAIFSTHNPLKTSIREMIQPPDAKHWFGTDELGRDVFSRVVHGARVSLPAASITILIACTIGVIAGVAAGYWMGWIDKVIMIFTDMLLAFPRIVLAMAIGAALGPSLRSAVLALAVAWWPVYARLVRSLTLQIKEQAYVEAADALGAKPLHTIRKHILPNALSAIIVRISLDLGLAVLTLASLGFIGIGVNAPTPEWGAMVSWGRIYFLTEWWIGGFPIIAITLVVIGTTFLGDALNDLFNPMAN